MWNHSGWPKASLPFHFLSQQGVPEAQPLLVTSTPASTQILQTNVQFTLQQQPTARPTSSKDTLEGKLTIAGLIFSDCDISYSISKPAAKRGIYTQRTRRDTADAALLLSHSHSLSPMRSYQGSITSEKVEQYKNTQSLCWAPRLLNKHRQRSPRVHVPDRLTPSLSVRKWGSEKVRKGECKGLKVRGSPVWVTSALNSSNYLQYVEGRTLEHDIPEETQYFT